MTTAARLKQAADAARGAELLVDEIMASRERDLSPQDENDLYDIYRTLVAIRAGLRVIARHATVDEERRAESDDDHSLRFDVKGIDY